MLDRGNVCFKRSGQDLRSVAWSVWIIRLRYTTLTRPENSKSVSNRDHNPHRCHPFLESFVSKTRDKTQSENGTLDPIRGMWKNSVIEEDTILDNLSLKENDTPIVKESWSGLRVFTPVHKIKLPKTFSTTGLMKRRTTFKFLLKFHDFPVPCSYPSVV